MSPYVNKVNAKYVAEKPEESQKPWPPVTEIVDLYKPGGYASYLFFRTMFMSKSKKCTANDTVKMTAVWTAHGQRNIQLHFTILKLKISFRVIRPAFL